MGLFDFLNNNDNTVTDIDGNVYKTIKIGNQVWMAENLRTTHFRNGDLIPYVEADDKWINIHSSAQCIYKNNYIYENVGRLYNFYAVNDKRKIAPKGWHIPSIDEFIKLKSFLVANQINDKQKLYLASLFFSNDIDKYDFKKVVSRGKEFSTERGSTWWSSTLIKSYKNDTAKLMIERYAEMYENEMSKPFGAFVNCVKNVI